MRLDKYLKTARILKRREAAKELALQGRITVNGRRAKPGTEVEIGDVLVLKFGNRCLTVRITDVKKQVSKSAAALLFEVVEETRIDESCEGRSSADSLSDTAGISADAGDEREND
ncbi:RNA-binding S4 domain-containing protein [uncultured Faecalibaculum sp.]|uniref:RNA-binding S4 domain-containing protein n=1 Tax=uncultured Faecalibaculum sp. TaxID=1729681 RepID=UPI0025E2194C|nr:RNA-binding S4 domain-containing protein [uncultured Faecalibaculum sp.]